jgi:sterol desaturase/sphingolipid hydroxylase (fatty acid hydroxylase superfamily)
MIQYGSFREGASQEILSKARETEVLQGEEMNVPILDSLLAAYQWKLVLYVVLGIVLYQVAGMVIMRVVPTFRAASKLNRETFQKKMEKPNYAANQNLNRKWLPVQIGFIFLVILPFCMTGEAQPWWNILLDIFVILMFYDFFYYLTHRFLFHDNGFLGGPLVWVHAVHHRQHNPCRMDSSYIHPIETVIGLGLYAVSVLVLSLIMGPFHFVTVLVTWIAFNEINLHNHDLWTVNRFPFKYLNKMSVMHHHHHAKFTGGNYATITLLYDWMFGTLDHGEGWKKRAEKNRARATAQ